MAVALVLVVTLTPMGTPNHVALAPWASRQLNALNLIGNIGLFAVPAAFLAALGWRLRLTVACGLGLSLAIELLQLAIPGRTTATVDVLCNTVGAAVGWWAVSRSRR